LNKRHRTAQLNDLLTQRILMLDGAMGTMIQSYKLNEVDYRGTRFVDFPQDLKGNNDLLTLTQQVEDYAKRKGWTLEQTEPWLAPVLAYER